jgi:hypothetical protein
LPSHLLAALYNGRNRIKKGLLLLAFKMYLIPSLFHKHPKHTALGTYRLLSQTLASRPGRRRSYVGLCVTRDTY